MFTNISMTGLGGLVLLIEAVFDYFGISVPEGSTLHALESVVWLIGWIFLIWGQIRRSDLIYGFFRK